MTKREFDNLKTGDRVQQKSHKLVLIDDNSVVLDYKTILTISKLKKYSGGYIEFEALEVEKETMFLNNVGDIAEKMILHYRELKIIKN